MRGLIFFLRDIKVAHSVFALPFAAAMLLLTPPQGVSGLTLLLILACFVTARSYAMGMNRVLDHRLDAANPRTAARMIPAGRLSWQQALCWSVVSALSFVCCCAVLGRTTFFLVSQSSSSSVVTRSLNVLPVYAIGIWACVWVLLLPRCWSPAGTRFRLRHLPSVAA